MDFTSYTGLKAAVAEYLNRDDLNAGSAPAVAGFIQLAEARMARRLMRSTNSGTLTFTSGQGVIALPSDCNILRSVIPVPNSASPNGGIPLAEVSYEMMNEKRSIGPATGIPLYYAIFNGSLYVAPVPAPLWLGVSVSYYTKLVPLSGTQASNAVLVEAPDAYLYGACQEAAPYLEHDERIATWGDKFDAAIDELNEKRQREEFGAGLKKARLPVCFG